MAKRSMFVGTDQTDLKNGTPGRGLMTRTHNAEAGALCLVDREQPYQRSE